MAAAAFPDDVVQLLKQLMSIPSNTGEEGEISDSLPLSRMAFIALCTNNITFSAF